MEEINVYVIENEQPFENWFGIWKYFQTINGVSGFYVENNKGDLILVNKTDVFESDTNLPIMDYIKYLSEEQTLLRFGLSKTECKVFIELLNKMNIPKEDLDNFESEMEEAIPFEGGMCFNEALVGLLQK